MNFHSIQLFSLLIIINLMLSFAVSAKNITTQVKDLEQKGIDAYQTGDLNQAVVYFEKALTIEIKMLGDMHTDVAKRRTSLGTILLESGDFDNAIINYNLNNCSESLTPYWIRTIQVLRFSRPSAAGMLLLSLHGCIYSVS